LALPCRINGGSQIPFAPLLVCWPAVFEDLCHYALGARRLARVALRDLIGCWLGKPPEAGVLAICGASAFSLSPAADLGADLNRSRKASAMELASEPVKRPIAARAPPLISRRNVRGQNSLARRGEAAGYLLGERRSRCAGQ
jgi:hypothetical protein